MSVVAFVCHIQVHSNTSCNMSHVLKEIIRVVLFNIMSSPTFFYIYVFSLELNNNNAILPFHVCNNIVNMSVIDFVVSKIMLLFKICVTFPKPNVFVKAIITPFLTKLCHPNFPFYKFVFFLFFFPLKFMTITIQY